MTLLEGQQQRYGDSDIVVGGWEGLQPDDHGRGGGRPFILIDLVERSPERGITNRA